MATASVPILFPKAWALIEFCLNEYIRLAKSRANKKEILEIFQMILFWSEFSQTKVRILTRISPKCVSDCSIGGKSALVNAIAGSVFAYAGALTHVWLFKPQWDNELCVQFATILWVVLIGYIPEHGHVFNCTTSVLKFNNALVGKVPWISYPSKLSGAL